MSIVEAAQLPNVGSCEAGLLKGSFRKAWAVCQETDKQGSYGAGVQQWTLATRPPLRALIKSKSTHRNRYILKFSNPRRVLTEVAVYQQRAIKGYPFNPWKSKETRRRRFQESGQNQEDDKMKTVVHELRTIVLNIVSFTKMHYMFSNVSYLLTNRYLSCINVYKVNKC